MTGVERAGVNFVRSIVEGANCIFHEIHKENDYGVDAFIEFVDAENVLGKSIAVQIKAGLSYRTGKTCTIPADRAHFEYWSNHSLTVLGIVYDPSEMCAYWTNITEYLKGHQKLMRDGPYSITFHKTDVHRFNETAFDQVFMPLLLRRPLLLDLETSKEWALDEDYEKHCLGISALLHRHRNSIEAWDVYLRILHERPVELTDPYLVYILALVPGHQDIFWHKSNTLDSQIRQQLRLKLASLALPEVAKLISFVDDYGFDRGTVGQNVDAVVNIVGDRARILREIIVDQTKGFQLRLNALLLYASYEQRSCVPFLEDLMRDSDSVLVPIASELTNHFRNSVQLHLY